MVITPVAEVQPGWVGVTVGAAGVGGGGLMVAGVAADTQPAAFLTVTL